LAGCRCHAQPTNGRLYVKSVPFQSVPVAHTLGSSAQTSESA